MRYRRYLIFSASLLLACVDEPVQWGDVSYRNSQLGDPDARSAIMSANLPGVPGTSAACIRSIRATGSGEDLFRVWWAARPDSSVVLSMQHSGDLGKSWAPATEVETRDRGRRGCARPAPGIFYDSVAGNLHLVYFIEASDGAGVFFAHSTDKGVMFHSPVPVVYGTSPSDASVAGRGDNVAVVFEDPNSNTQRIGIVLSRVTGHIFDQRGQVTPDEAAAVKPWVALAGDTIKVWWKVSDPSGVASDRVGFRSGVWR